MVNQCRWTAFFLLTIATFALGKVQVYHPATIYPRSAQFSLRAGGKKVPIIAYAHYDYAHFSADNGEQIEVHVHGKAPIDKYSIVYSRFDTYSPPELKKNNLVWKFQDDHNYYILNVKGLRELVIAVDPLETDVPTSSGKNIFNIADRSYGADRHGHVDSTEALTKALLDASNSVEDSPIVYVPKGVYSVKNIVLPSDVSLYLAPGSVLRLKASPEELRSDWTSDGEGRSGTNWITTAHNSTNIKIFGRGTIDGRGHKYSDQKFAPSLVVPILTKNFVLDGPILRDSGSTALNVIRSEQVTITNVKVLNQIEDMVDNGSVNLVESQNVIVKDALAISVADTFATTATEPARPDAPTWPGALRNASDIVFTNCLAWTANYGFKVGQGAMSDQSNIKFLASTIYDSAVGMGIHKKWGPGSVSDVTFDQIIVKHMRHTTSYLTEEIGSWIALLVEDGGSGVGPITDVDVKNILVLHNEGISPLINGVEGAPVSNVRFDNVYLMEGKGSEAASLHDIGFGEMVYAHNITFPANEAEES